MRRRLVLVILILLLVAGTCITLMQPAFLRSDALADALADASVDAPDDMAVAPSATHASAAPAPPSAAHPSQITPAPTLGASTLDTPALDASSLIDPDVSTSAQIWPTEPSPPPVYTARIAFTGDLMVHEWQLDSAYNRESDTYMFSSFEDITPYLTDAHYTVGNLETTLAGREAGYATYPLFNTPDAFAEAIKAAGFDFLSTANNHCYDKGEKGVRRTLQVLDELGLFHAGTYASAEESERIFITDINRIRFAFLSYTYGTNGIPVAADKPYLVNLLDEDQIRRQIGQARQAGADVVVVLPHMGIEYAQKPNAAMTTLARNMCQWGADVVMASHPHVLQPTEIVEVEEPDGTTRTCFIAYSMGNFISSQRTVPRDASAIFYLSFSKTTGLPNAQPTGTTAAASVTPLTGTTAAASVTQLTGSTAAASVTQLTGVAFTPTWVKFVDAQGRYDIRVLPVYDTLRAVERGEAVDLRATDINRLRAVHRETTRTLLGEEVPAAAIRPRYVLYGSEESFSYAPYKLQRLHPLSPVRRDTDHRRRDRLSHQLAGYPDAVPAPW